MKHFAHAPFLLDGEHRPWRYRFLPLCRWIEARSAPAPKLGEEAHPHNEEFRLGQEPSTAFAPREIAAIRRERGKILIRLYGLGMHGPNGPLPLHLTEEAHERQLQSRDTTLTDFLDLFHHRWLSLFYRAWAEGQATAGLDRPDDERFSRYVSSLIGHDRKAMARSSIPSHALLAAAGHLVMQSRNPAALAVTLRQFWGLHFHLEEYQFHWLALEPEDYSRLGDCDSPCRLGRDAVLGTRVPDRQSLFALFIGPLSLEDYCRFLPTGDSLPLLMAWVREFIGLEMRWTVSLLLKPEEVPQGVLGGAGRLGRTVWLTRRRNSASVQGKTFEPEACLDGER